MCNEARCPTHPHAACFVDWCRGCKVIFLDPNNEEVGCHGNSLETIQKSNKLTRCQLVQELNKGYAVGLRDVVVVTVAVSVESTMVQRVND